MTIIDPLEAHHRQNRRWPVFEQLVDQTRAKGGTVGLKVTSVLLDPGTPEQRRVLEAIVVRQSKATSVERKVRAGDLDATAQEFLS